MLRDIVSRKHVEQSSPLRAGRLRKTARGFFAAALLAAAPAGAAELTVFAAASLSDALREIAPLYTKTSGDVVRFNFGGSGTLARQIREGARADVFFSADELRMDQLDQAGLLLADTRRTLLANTLVVIVAAERGAPVEKLTDLANAEVRRVAIGEPATVAAGAYAKERLQQADLWQPLLGKLAPLGTVRAVLAAVESGNADAGVVFKTDALSSKKVKIAIETPRWEGSNILYPAAVVKDARSPEAARAFIAFLAGPEAQAVFLRSGFLQPE